MTKSVYDPQGVLGPTYEYSWSTTPIYTDERQRKSEVIYTEEYDQRYPAYQFYWSNCTAISGVSGQCTDYTVFYNDYTGSMYSRTVTDGQPSDTYV